MSGRRSRSSIISVEYGGKTVVDPTNLGIGRDPSALQRISRRTGLNIVMGAGFYLEPSHPPYVKDMTVETIAEAIARDCGLSEDQPEVCAGIIGEIGISKDFTPAEEKVLRGAARASKLSGAPLSVHLPGWERHAHRVLDVVESEGADLRHVVLCHMNPSLHDPKYQRSVADRGAFIEYDMIGMDFFYADQQAQSPCDEENAVAICRLVDDGYLGSILMSQDVFLKMMLVRYGGFGYGYILKHFVPRLKRHGMGQRTIDHILTRNRGGCSRPNIARADGAKQESAGGEQPNKMIHVIGNAAVDSVIRVERFPRPGETIVALGASEDLGGKGANQAVVVARAARRFALSPNRR